MRAFSHIQKERAYYKFTLKIPKQLLAGGPGHTSSTKDVEVDVEDILS
jgi:hypothetical protein